MTGEVYAIEVTAYDPDLGATRALAFCTGPGFCSKPSDTPANTHFLPCVVEAGNYSQYMVDALVTDGRGRAGFGQIVLNNADGRLDAVRGYGLDGRAVVIRRGTPGAAYPSAWTTLLTGVLEQAEFTWDALTLVIKDRLGELANKPLSPARYAGDNALPDGVEGTEDDLKGKPKPVLYGRALNVAPPCVNTSKLTYQVSARQVTQIDEVYVGGAAVTAGTAHASLAALQAATVSAGTYDYYLGSGSDGAYFRLQGAVTAAVTCDATQDFITAGQAARQMLLDQGTDPGDIDDDTVDELDGLAPGAVGLWTGAEETTFGPAMDRVLASAGGFWAADAAGTFYFGALVAPEDAGDPVKVIKPYAVYDGAAPVERLRGRADDRGVPCHRVLVDYARNYTVQRAADLGGSVTQVRRAFLAEEYRTTTAEDPGVLTAHLLAGERRAATLLADESDALDLAARLLELHGTQRDFLRVRLPATEAPADTRLGRAWALDAPRFDWAGGKPFVLVGLTFVFGSNEMIPELWG